MGETARSCRGRYLSCVRCRVLHHCTTDRRGWRLECHHVTISAHRATAYCQSFLRTFSRCVRATSIHERILLSRSCEFHQGPRVSFWPLGFRWRKLRVRFRRSQNYVVIHAVFAMNVGQRVFRRGDHFEKSLPRRVTDQHHKLPVLGVEVAIGRTLDVTRPEDRSSDSL